MLFSRIDRFVSLLLVASLLLCCVPTLAVPAAAAGTEMYLYNGVELPDINEVWTDKEKYPYAYIGYTGLEDMPYMVNFSSKQAEMVEIGGTVLVEIQAHANVQYYTADSASSNWTLAGEVNNTDYDNVIGSTEGTARVIWTNTDILNIDGTTYLAASKPVPVNYSSSITSVSIISPETVQAGLYIVASVDVAGTGDFDSSATLTLSGNTSSGTYLEKADTGNNWMLFCGSDETASTLTLTAASVQDSTVTASTSVTVEHAIVEPTDPTDPSDPDDPEDPSDPVEPTTPDEIQPGNSGALTDKSDQISDGLGDIHDFEQSQKDVLDNNIDTIMVQVDFVNLIPALAFVGNYINLAWVSMLPIQLIFTVPLFLGLFFFLCSRIPGATRWKARRPPPDPTKKR